MEKTQHPVSAAHTRDERVEHLAFQLWEEQGRPEGKSEEHWYIACTIIDGEAAGATSEDLPTWLNRDAETTAKTEKPALVQELNHKRRSAA